MTRPYAIVLGAAVRAGGTPSPTLRRRAERAAQLWQAGGVAGIVATGAVGRHPPSEAEVIRAVLVGCGVPAEAVLLEDRSRSTLDNLAFARALMPAGATAVIVSDVWHLPRARLAARRLGLPATAVRASLRGSHPGRVLRASMREAVAFAWYLIRPMR